jgi:meromycolic acid enoyl-[acyl-carrier-protein] reductase
VLAGKRILITGVATPDSIAFATARSVLDLGGRVVLTAFPRDLDAATELAAALDPAVPVLALDLCDGAGLAAVTGEIGRRIGGLDGALHAVAFAPAGALGGDLTATDPADVELAFRTSAWTLAALAGALRDLAPASGASLVGLDFDANDGAWPVYNWMGVCKAALRATARYLARDLGAIGLRVNLVAAGPLQTRAARGIPDFDRLLDAWATTAPLRWDATDARPVAEAACFLLSDHARAVTGEILHVDGGYHAMAAPLHPDRSAASEPALVAAAGAHR